MGKETARWQAGKGRRVAWVGSYWVAWVSTEQLMDDLVEQLVVIWVSSY